MIAKLLEMLAENPEDEGIGFVLVDALTQAGDVRGELAAVQSRRAALAALLDELAGDKRDDRAGDGVSIHVAYGIAESISVTVGDDDYKAKRSGAALLAKALEPRPRRLVRKVWLRLGGTKSKAAVVAKDAAAALAVLVERAPVVRSLDVALYAKGDVDVDLGPCLAALPITELSLVAPAPTIRTFLASTHAKLERLAIRGSDGLTLAHVKRLLDGTAVPALRHIQPDLDVAIVKKLIASPLATRLESLDVSQSGSSFDAAAVRALVAAKPKLKQLERLEINGEYLDTKVLRSLKGFCRQVIGVPDDAQLAWVDAKVAEHLRADRYEELEE